MKNDYYKRKNTGNKNKQILKWMQLNQISLKVPPD